MEERVQEVVHEKMMINTHEEIPYIAGIHCISIENIAEGKIKVDVNIYVDNSAQQRIVVGEKGRTLVKIRQDVVVILEELTGKKALLYLWVKVRSSENVDDDEEDDHTIS
jgi:GTP-binding protein Era